MTKFTNDAPGFQLSVQFVDKKNRPTTVDGAPQWTSTGPGTLTVAEDGYSATLTPSPDGQIGVGQVNVTADADRTANVRLLTLAPFDYEVLAAEAVGGGFTAVPLPEIVPPVDPGPVDPPVDPPPPPAEEN